MAEPTEHDRHTVLELRHNLSALDIESIVPWSTDVIPEHKYDRLRAAAVLAFFKLDFVETEADHVRTESIKTGLLQAADNVFIADMIKAGVRKSMNTHTMRWTHSA